MTILPEHSGSVAGVGLAGRAVIVTDANHSVSLPFIRSLDQHGLRVVAASHERDTLGFRSRHATAHFSYPWPGRDEAGFIGRVVRAARYHRAALIVPLSEAAVMALDRNRHLLPAGCLAALPPSAALRVAIDKLRTIELAQRLAVPVPASALARSPAEAGQHAARLRPPYALKRSAGYQPLGTLYAMTSGEVVAQAERLMPDGEPIIVQEYLAGYGVGVNLLMRRGQPVLAFQHRRLREVPISGGASALRESVPLDPLMYRHAVRLLAELDWTGLAMVEFRVGSDGHRLMEINGRAWGSLPLAQAAGVDFPAGLASLYLDASDEEPPDAQPDTELDAGEPSPARLQSYQLGVRSRNLQLDVVWALAVLLRRPQMRIDAWPPRREGLRALLQLLDPGIRFDVLSRDDPAPGLLEIARLARYLVGRLLRR